MARRFKVYCFEHNVNPYLFKNSCSVFTDIQSLSYDRGDEIKEVKSDKIKLENLFLSSL